MFRFVNEVRTEISKVVWPTRAETIKLTVIVLTISVSVGLYLGGLDFLFTQMLKYLIS